MSAIEFNFVLGDAARQRIIFLARPFLLMFDWRGRATRREMLMAVAIASLCLSPVLLVPISEADPTLIVNFAAALAILTGTAVRRCHDSGRAGWVVCIILAPYVGILVLGVVLCLNGERFENIYGPDPR